jgi:hypothetical protein
VAKKGTVPLPRCENLEFLATLKGTAPILATGSDFSTRAFIVTIYETVRQSKIAKKHRIFLQGGPNGSADSLKLGNFILDPDGRRE